MKNTFIAILLTFSMLFSMFYVVHEANHDCSGDDCIVCQIINVIEQAKTGDNSVAEGFHVIAKKFVKDFKVNSQNKFYNKDSLISLKIKLIA
ncbi:MAG: hypothetical protein K6F69_01860 [Treponema sp.]|nr:hypothetical protein [Treponema sp.]